MKCWKNWGPFRRAASCKTLNHGVYIYGYIYYIYGCIFIIYSRAENNIDNHKPHHNKEFTLTVGRCEKMSRKYEYMLHQYHRLRLYIPI